MIGDSLARLERYKEAEPYLEEEVRLYPQHVRARAGLAMLYQSMGRNAEAERALGDLVRDVPSPDAADTAARVWRCSAVPTERIRSQTRRDEGFASGDRAQARDPARALSPPSSFFLPPSRPSGGGLVVQPDSSSRPTRTAMSWSSPSTRCGRMPCPPMVDAPARRASMRSRRAARGSPSPMHTPWSRCRRIPAC